MNEHFDFAKFGADRTACDNAYWQYIKDHPLPVCPIKALDLDYLGRDEPAEGV